MIGIRTLTGRHLCFLPVEEDRLFNWGGVPFSEVLGGGFVVGGR